MTRQDLINKITASLTISGRLPNLLPEAELHRIIDEVKLFFYEDYQYGVQQDSYVIEQKCFNNVQFRGSRQLILPEDVVSVIRFQEINGIGRLGNIDRDFAEDRLIASEIFISAFHGDDLVTRTAQYSYFDLSRAFFLEQIAYDYNKNTHLLKVLGRDPKFDVYIETWSKIPEDKLFDDYLFLRWCQAEAKISLGNMVTLYDFNLPGGIKIDGATLRDQGQTEIERIREEIKSKDSPDWFLIYH